MVSDDFDACDYRNVEKALGSEDLRKRLRANWRDTLVALVQTVCEAPSARAGSDDGAPKVQRINNLSRPGARYHYE